LMNNAGISHYKNLKATASDLAGLTTELNVNVGGVIRMTSAFIDILKANKGSLINVSSALAFVPLPCIPI
ncbi:SDR family NAD(P)-dependent oxidoreductase, partial [Salmonella enterica]|uniref:SDR family NAD(P)-dependent oxidoreductase n=2 Tax=Pseudomonadota TaxID=1224 RepID=UPI003CF9329F